MKKRIAGIAAAFGFALAAAAAFAQTVQDSPELYPGEPFRELAKLLDGREQPPSHPYWADAAPCSMHIEEVESIWSAIAERDDWRPFEDKVRAIRRMGEAMKHDAPAA